MNTTARTTATLAALAIGALSLTACGGGGGGGIAPPVGQTTPPVRVNLAGVESTHLEHTDNVDIIDEEGATSVETGQIRRVMNYRRLEMVCPGLAHNGNTCMIVSEDVDGEVLSLPSDRRTDASIDFVAEFYNHLQHTPFSLNGVVMIRGEHDTPDVDGNAFLVLGGRGEYSAFYTSVYHHRFGDRTWAGAFGYLYRDHPNADQGSATWRGAMTGATRARGTEVEGRSLLEYDFSNDTLDLTLDQIAASRYDESGFTYEGPSSFVWQGLPANADGSFYIPGYGNDKPGTPLHPTLGYVDGDFYGPNAAEFGGVFERDGVVGAFGGARAPE